MEYNQIIQGDSLAILKTLPDESVDMVFTDPPYIISQKGLKIDRTNIQNRSSRRNGRKSKELNYDFGEWDHFKSREDFLQWTDDWVKECFRVLKNTGNFVSFFSKSEISHFEDILNKYGHVRQAIVWHKTNPVPQIFKVGFMSSIEFMSWATKQKGAKHTFNHKLGQHHNYIETPICMGKEREDHPTQKPLKAVIWLIKYLSNKDDIILDPFCGVGTIPVACKELGRRYLGIELKQEYIDMANKRIRAVRELLF